MNNPTIVNDFKIENDKVLIFNAPDWLKGRENYIGGSESFAFGADILKVNYKWNTPFTLWCKKSGYGIERDSAAMKHGRQREPFLLRLAENLINIKYKQKSQVFASLNTYVMRDYPFIGANLDGIVQKEDGSLAGLEIKTASYKYGWTDNDIPFVYKNQIQHYMLVTGLEEFFVLAEVCTEKLSYRIKADKVYQEKLLNKMVSFWACVENKTRPDIKNVNCEKEYIEKLDGMIEELLEMPELLPLLKEYCIERDIKKSSDLKSKNLKKQLQNAIKPGHIAKIGDYRVSARIVSCPHLDIPSIKRDEPLLYEKFLIKTDREIFYVSEKESSKKPDNNGCDQE